MAEFWTSHGCRSRAVVLLGVFCLSLCQAGFSAEGLTRKPWTTSNVRGAPEPPPPYRAERLFPKLTTRFKNPTTLSFAPGSNRLFVGEQAGKIWSFVNDAGVEQADLFLDLPPLLKTLPANSEVKGLEALYGLTFHPDFANNRYCYVCYVVSNNSTPNNRLPNGTRVSRFEVSRTDPPRCIPESEQIVITWLQGGHNGGCLEFGPKDGLLYISTGDGGFANPPDGLNAGQDLSHLLSKVLRIDVNRTQGSLPYAIPEDNPFVGLEGARGETWCYGLRNPWRISLDRQTNDLWVGDVGWELWELVYRVQKGGNYGWSVVEGSQQVHPERKMGPTPILPATVEIPHTDGVSITGGYVYRGKKLPELVGTYLFGDWETRRVWGVTWDGKQATPRRDLLQPTIRLVAFAQDAEGELYLMDYDDGSISTLARNEAAASENRKFPTKLSETGLFESVADQVPAAGVLPFSINAEQWADHATAQRFVAIPGDGKVTLRKNKREVAGSMFQLSSEWPKDSVLAKTISLETERGKPGTRVHLETQLLHYDGQFWRGYSYQWNKEQTDATLVEATGTETTIEVDDSAAPGGKLKQSWHFPSRVECFRCHNQWAEFALGFNLRQLNKDHVYEPAGIKDNQLRALEQAGLIALPDLDMLPTATPKLDGAAVAAAFPSLKDPYRDTDGDTAERARSYLHVNCAHCHRTGGGGSAYMELRADLEMGATKTLDVRPTQGTFGIHDARLIAPGDPFRSVLYYRTLKLGSGRMPHIGSEIVDERGVQLLHDWIQALPRHVTELASIDRLKSLEHPTKANERAIAIGELLSKTSSAMLLSKALHEGTLTGSARDEVVSLAAAHPDVAIRDLFESFLPDDKRPKRLGTAVNVAALLARPGNADRGRALFLTTANVACKNCHVAAGQGSKLGPDLSQIGKKLSRAQILESILEPSKAIEPKYVVHVAETVQGKVVSGLLVERNEREVILKDAKDAEIRLPAGDIERLVTQRQSLMPDLQLRDLTVEQVADLLDFLAAQK